MVMRLLVGILAMVMIYCGQVEAADYYLGEYESGQAAYLDTDSIRKHEVTQNGYFDHYMYICTVKAVYTNSNEWQPVAYEVTCWSGPLTYQLKKNGKILYDRRTVNEYLKKHRVERNLIEYIRVLHER